MEFFNQSKLTLLFLAMLVSQFAFSQDTKSAILFSNHTDLLFTLDTRVTGDESMVNVGKSDILPWEGSNYHDLGDRVITTILDLVFNIDVSHKNQGHLVRCERLAFLGEKSHDVEIDVLHDNELIFTIEYKFVDFYFDLNNPVFYNIRYPDDTRDVENSYSLSVEEHNSPHQANREIMINNRSYKLIYGTFNNATDPTNNLIFSLSETEPTTLHQEANLADIDDPTVLNVVTYNIGLLMPLGANDQEERERVPVLHQAMPKNMDIIIWQEMFEQYWVNIIIDSLIEYYPYYTSPHNQPDIPGLTKNGGCLIMSKHPILEEDDFSYTRDGDVTAFEDDALADKGVKYAKVNKNGQIIHVFNTHTGGQDVENDVMGKWMNERIEQNYDDIVIMGGDMNTKLYSGQYYQMIDSLKAVTPTYLTLQSRALETRGTTWGYNHYNSGRGDAANFIDYVFASSQFKVPTFHYNETQTYRLNITDKPFWGVFDLGDHQPVYSRMEFPTIDASISDTAVCIDDEIEILVETSLEEYEVNWYKDGELIPNENNLTFSKNITSSSDLGHYQCELTYFYEADETINGDTTYGYTIIMDSTMSDTIIIDSIPIQFEEYFHPGPEKGKLVRSFLVQADTSICPELATSIFQLNAKDLKIYPNPIDDFLEIEVKGKYEIRILNSSGSTIYQGSISNKSTVETKKWSKGMYFIEFYDREVLVYTANIVKQ